MSIYYSGMHLTFPNTVFNERMKVSLFVLNMANTAHISSG